MVKVVVTKNFETGENENLDSLLKRFKKQVTKANILGEIRKRAYYKSKPLKRKEKSIAAQKRIKKRKKNKNYR